MKKVGVLVLFFIFLFGCQNIPPETTFRQFAEQHYPTRHQHFTLQAILDDHRPLDSLLPIFQSDFLQKQLHFCKSEQTQLLEIPVEQLNQPMQFEYRKIQQFLDTSLQKLEKDSVYFSDPNQYNLLPIFEKLFRQEALSTRQQDGYSQSMAGPATCILSTGDQKSYKTSQVLLK